LVHSLLSGGKGGGKGGGYNGIPPCSCSTVICFLYVGVHVIKSSVFFPVSSLLHTFFLFLAARGRGRGPGRCTDDCYSLSNFFFFFNFLQNSSLNVLPFFYHIWRFYRASVYCFFSQLPHFDQAPKEAARFKTNGPRNKKEKKKRKRIENVLVAPRLLPQKGFVSEKITRLGGGKQGGEGKKGMYVHMYDMINGCKEPRQR
jgi:hypothetical protein